MHLHINGKMIILVIVISRSSFVNGPIVEVAAAGMAVAVAQTGTKRRPAPRRRLRTRRACRSPDAPVALCALGERARKRRRGEKFVLLSHARAIH